MYCFAEGIYSIGKPKNVLHSRCKSNFVNNTISLKKNTITVSYWNQDIFLQNHLSPILLIRLFSHKICETKTRSCFVNFRCIFVMILRKAKVNENQRHEYREARYEYRGTLCKLISSN